MQSTINFTCVIMWKNMCTMYVPENNHLSTRQTIRVNPKIGDERLCVKLFDFVKQPTYIRGIKKTAMRKEKRTDRKTNEGAGKERERESTEKK